ncbi:hypothetical protein G6F68_014963 [Rhizopus microsporus]|nr:hypothetical protein G6F68_014963 [Rhizopus microsporus]
MGFDIEPFRKYCLLNGFDDIGLTLRHADKIRAFEAERLARHPWLESRRARPECAGRVLRHQAGPRGRRRVRPVRAPAAAGHAEPGQGIGRRAVRRRGRLEVRQPAARIPS